MRKLVLLGLVQTLLLLAGCGGGSSGTLTTSDNGSGSGQSSSTNTVTMTVDSGPDPSAGYDVDTPFITVTVCAPGSTTNCQTIDDVEVDTGSYGLRVISSVLNASLASALQQETSSGNPVVECTAFADGFSWGPVEVADVQIAGESASNVPIQVMGDPTYEQTSGSGSSAVSEIPTSCSTSTTGGEEDTVATFGANGIIGVGPFADDCGSGCALATSNPDYVGFYYECPASSWSPSNPCSNISLAESAQVTDPVVDFETDNNGVIIELPSATEGASSVTGTLVFGIGTEGNNSLTAKTVLTASSDYGDITTNYTTQGGTQQVLPFSYLDTGSNAYYFADQSIPSLQSCSSYPGYDSSDPDSWFCPSSELSLSATNTGLNGTQSTVSFSIGNAYTLFNDYSGSVFNDLGASSGSEDANCDSATSAANDGNCAFDFGFPFFLGRNVFIAFAGANTSGGAGPYFAY